MSPHRLHAEIDGAQRQKRALQDGRVRKGESGRIVVLLIPRIRQALCDSITQLLDLALSQRLADQYAV
jgi:hypothetical protein